MSMQDTNTDAQDTQEKDKDEGLIPDANRTMCDHVRLCDDCKGKFWTIHESKCMACRDTI